MAERGEDPGVMLTPSPPTASPTVARLAHRSRREPCRIHESGQTPPGGSRSVSARLQFSARKKLSYTNEDASGACGGSLRSHGSVTEEAWSNEETKALLEFLLFHKGPGAVWFKRGSSNFFWLAAAKFVRDRARTQLLRSAGACRIKVTSHLMKNFRAPEAALRAFEGRTSVYAPSPILHHRDNSSQTDTPKCDILGQMKSLLATVSDDDQAAAVGELLQFIAPPDVNVPPEFVMHALTSMQRLKQAGRSNILAGLAKALGTMRPDGSDSRMPVSKMPVGLIEYAVSFFSSDTFYQTISCPEDYRLWCEAMYCLFGTKWTKIHGGPMWSVEAVTQGQSRSLGASRNIVDARVNVPMPSVRTLQRNIAASNFSADASIQISVLDEADKAHRGVWWWVKGDGCDIKAGLGESLTHVWSGDVDLCDGSLQELYATYMKCRSFIEGLGLEGRQGQWDISIDLSTLELEMTADIEFTTSELASANTEYSTKLASGKATDKTLQKLSWNVDDLTHLNEEGRELLVHLRCIQELAEGTEARFLSCNAPRQLTQLRNKVLIYLQNVYRFRRVAATHIFVLMISPEQRNRKPYALPVQCIPYTSLKHTTCRKLVQTLVSEMNKRGMKVAGFTSNGEFNSLRCRGITRPLSVLQVKADVRVKYGAMRQQKMRAMFSPKRLCDGSIVADIPNPAVSDSLLWEIMQWKAEGVGETEIHCRLCCRTVPPGYTPFTWKPGKTETDTEVLRSILAQLEYSYLVEDYSDRQGVPFREHLYVPEINPITNAPFCEREDEAHVLKQVGHSTRSGGPAVINLARFEEALHDPEAQLTYTALTGERKQSVRDAERLFSPSLLAFMEKRGYFNEAKYIRVVLNWRRSCDERGLSELQRCRYNHQMLNYILEELMPWHHDYDFSHLEVNRPVNCICGFTRETLHAMVANMEGREFRRVFLASLNLPPEHPRACSTDDVECFFSVMRDTLGSDFALKRVLYGWKRMCLEFSKRVDPNMPFYYFTSSHGRFYEAPRPEFSIPPQRQHQPQRPRQREMIVGQAPGRTTLPVAGSRSVRLTYHNVPVSMPPAPQSRSYVTDHPYF